jgi:hypothetical protein
VTSARATSRPIPDAPPVTDAASPAGQSMRYSFAVFPGSRPAGELGPWLAVEACGEHRRSRRMSADRPAVRAHRSVGSASSTAWPLPRFSVPGPVVTLGRPGKATAQCTA